MMFAYITLIILEKHINSNIGYYKKGIIEKNYKLLYNIVEKI